LSEEDGEKSYGQPVRPLNQPDVISHNILRRAA
jgi:hypothetical protein